MKDKNKPLKIRQLLTMHRALAKDLNSELVTSDGEINSEDFKKYLKKLSRGRSLQVQDQSLLYKYCQNLSEYIQRAINPVHKVNNWFILVSKDCQIENYTIIANNCRYFHTRTSQFFSNRTQ